MRAYLSKPVDGASLAALRIGFGVLLASIALGFLTPLDGSSPSNVDRLLTGSDTHWHFSYPAMPWWKPLPQPYMNAAVWTCLIASLFLAAGLFTRLAAIVAFLSFTYTWTCDASLYGNHFPLATVLAAALIFVPCNRRFAIDRLFRTMSTSVPFWSVFLVRAQVFLIYFFGGLSKVHPDWLAGEPMRTWFHDGATADLLRQRLSPALAEGVVIPLLGQQATVYAFSYAGLAFDLTIGLLLCVRRTRMLGLVLATGFHAFNFFFVDKVGVVATMSWWATLIFLDAQWPIRLARWLRNPVVSLPDPVWFLFGMFLVPIFGAALGWKLPPSQTKPDPLYRPMFRFGAALLIGWIAFAVLLPLRHFVIPGDAYWTEEGVAFSWFLLTRNKHGEFIQFRVDDPGLVKTTDNGAQEIDWARWKGERPQVEIRDFEVWSTDQSSANLPELFVTFEPVLGCRVFRRLSSTAQDDATFLQSWRQRFGREPSLRPTQSALQALFEVRRIAAKQHANEPRFESLCREVDIAALRLAEITNNPENDIARRVALIQLVRATERILLAARASPQCTHQLVRTAPFSLQGGALDPQQFQVVVDFELFDRKAKGVAWWISPERWGEPLPLYCDLSILPESSLRTLPLCMALRDTAGYPGFLWNFTRELNPHQIKAMGLFPYLMRQYAEHIADRWQVQQGRSPAVHVQSFAWLNHHGYQRLIDQEIDLASADYHLLKHNDWILPMTRLPLPHALANQNSPAEVPPSRESSAR